MSKWIIACLLFLAIPVHAGQVAYWRFDETSGNAIDVVGGLSGALGSGATRTTTNCRVQGCLTFDDTTNASVTVTTPAALDLTTAFSLSVWVRPTSSTGTDGILEKTVGGTINTAYSLFFEASGLRFRVDKGGLTTITADAVPSTTATEHYVATYDGATMRLYRQAVLQAATASVAAPIDGGSGNFLLGTLAGGIYPYGGLLDDVRVYDHALSQAEITRLFIRARAR
jgi:hypothetical protein